MGDAARWLDEALRHVDLPMLRYLYAYCLVEAARLPAEAARHVAAAESRPLTAPFPSRSVERRALRQLQVLFSQNIRISAYLNLSNSADSYLR